MCDSADRANKLADCCLRTYATDYITGMCEEMYLVQMIICIAQVTIFAGNVCSSHGNRCVPLQLTKSSSCLYSKTASCLVWCYLRSKVIPSIHVWLVTSSNWPQGSVLCVEICPKPCKSLKGVMSWKEGNSVVEGSVIVVVQYKGEHFVFIKIRHFCLFYWRVFINHACFVCDIIKFTWKVSK